VSKLWPNLNLSPLGILSGWWIQGKWKLHNWLLVSMYLHISNLGEKKIHMSMEKGITLALVNKLSAIWMHARMSLQSIWDQLFRLGQH
jgi:hypothetical protein